MTTHNSKIRSLILRISVTLCMATRHVYISRGRFQIHYFGLIKLVIFPAFFKCTLGKTYMLYVFAMTTEQGRILEQTGRDIENWL